MSPVRSRAYAPERPSGTVKPTASLKAQVFPQAPARSSKAAEDVLIGGRYIDRFERRDGVWRIIQRTGVHDWRRYEAPADHGFYQTPPAQRGRRNRDDQVYDAAF